MQLCWLRIMITAVVFCISKIQLKNSIRHYVPAYPMYSLGIRGAMLILAMYFLSHYIIYLFALALVLCCNHE